MFLELTEDKLQEIINSNAKVMVQYGASWCGNCRIMKPKFKNWLLKMKMFHSTMWMQKNFLNQEN